jgi:lambda repressor-like predicted transcriptional regulator
MMIAPATTINRNEIPADRNARRAWIKYRLAERGITLSDLAARLGVTHQALSKAATGATSARCQAALAETLGLPPHHLFPENHDSTGAPLSRRAPSNPTPQTGEGESAERRENQPTFGLAAKVRQSKYGKADSP